MAKRKAVVGEDSVQELEQVETEQEETSERAVGEFPEKYREPVLGLLYVGKLTDSIEFAGHTFDIRTITEGELLQVGQLIKRFNDTAVYDSAYRAVMVAACIERVDGKPLYTPISQAEDDLVGKFSVVMDWYPVVIDRVFEAYMALERMVLQIVEELGKA